MRRLLAEALPVALALAVAGCGLGAIDDAAPSAPPVVQPSLSPTLQAARTAVVEALGTAAIQVRDAQVAYRPGESALVTPAPRAVLQAVLPGAADGGWILVYEFIDPTAAAAAGREWADYIASGIGRVQFPTGSVFTIRQLGSALVFHSYAPDGAADPEAEAAIAAALATLGTGWPVGA